MIFRKVHNLMDDICSDCDRNVTNPINDTQSLIKNYGFNFGDCLHWTLRNVSMRYTCTTCKFNIRKLNKFQPQILNNAARKKLVLVTKPTTYFAANLEVTIEGFKNSDLTQTIKDK